MDLHEEKTVDARSLAEIQLSEFTFPSYGPAKTVGRPDDFVGYRCGAAWPRNLYLSEACSRIEDNPDQNGFSFDGQRRCLGFNRISRLNHCARKYMSLLRGDR